MGGGSAACCSRGLAWGRLRTRMKPRTRPVRSAYGVEVQIYTKHLARQEAFILTRGFKVISITSVYQALTTGQTRYLRRVPIISPTS